MVMKEEICNEHQSKCNLDADEPNNSVNETDGQDVTQKERLIRQLAGATRDFKNYHTILKAKQQEAIANRKIIQQDQVRKVAKEIQPTMDKFHKQLEIEVTTDEGKQIKQGMQMIYDQINEVIKGV